MDVTNIIAGLSPEIGFWILMTCVVSIIAGGASCLMLMRQPKSPMDMNTILSRGELLLLYSLFVMERMATALSFFDPKFMILNACIKMALAVALVMSAIVMARRTKILGHGD